MPDTNSKASAFFEKLTDWRDELHALRAILLDTPLTEEFKWHSPVYTYDGGNVAIVWGFKDRATLGFFKGILLTDPQNILELPGENSRSSKIVNFTDVAQIKAAEETIRAYIAEAIQVEESGAKISFPKDDLEYPEELIRRLDGDDRFKAAFEALTPGRQRGWVLHFSTAKQSKTRDARIEKAAPKILAGKGMNDWS
ncbi:YdeI/OmpD-associated family protein [Paracoccus sp. 11-3]|uniref:YdeI/OmpD-associated family protein n=1 Tax=Paracoccus amoyensis TaxID=2760093 RepID=A0A926GFI2_9RHOB|nr:YdeI/OmpD-associated family protein [Paracoccus amoyensis]MBC9246389.1 YdeI/OmpD-associated family protein [Paracoccus amoyensis]